MATEIYLTNVVIMAMAPVPTKKNQRVSQADLSLVAMSKHMCVQDAGYKMLAPMTGMYMIAPTLTTSRKGKWDPQKMLRRGRKKGNVDLTYTLGMTREASGGRSESWSQQASLIIPNIYARGVKFDVDKCGGYVITLPSASHLWHHPLHTNDWGLKVPLPGTGTTVNGHDCFSEQNPRCPKKTGKGPDQVDDGGLPWPPK